MNSRLPIRFIFFSTLISTLSLLVACGGGGNDPGVAPITGTVTCPTFTTGDAFTYQHNSSITINSIGTFTLSSFTRTVTVIPSTAGKADMEARFSHNSDVDTYYHNSNTSNFELISTNHVSTSETSTVTYATPYKLCTPPTVGDIYTATVVTTNTTTSTSTTTTAKTEVTLVGTESVTVPAGTYPSARRIDTITRFYDSSGTHMAGSDVTSNLWFDDNAGEVKSVTKKSGSYSTYTGEITNTIERQ